MYIIVVIMIIDPTKFDRKFAKSEHEGTAC